MTDSPETPKGVISEGRVAGTSKLSGTGAEKDNPILIDEDESLSDNTVTVSTRYVSNERTTNRFDPDENDGSPTSIGRGRAR